MPDWLYTSIKNLSAVKKMNQDRGTVPYAFTMQEALVLAASFMEKPRPILVIKQNLYQAQRLFDRLMTLLPEADCALFGADESLRVEAIAASPQMQAVQVETLASLLQNPCQIVVTCPSAVLRHLPFPEDFAKGCFSLKVDQNMSMEELKGRLFAGGYQQAAHIDQPLTFAMRGGIVDVWSMNYDQPLRIEFFDTVIDSIRFFDIHSQKTIEKVEEAEIIPASDVLFTPEQIAAVEKAANELVPSLPAAVEADFAALEAGISSSSMYSYFALLDQTAGLWDYMPDLRVVISDPSAVNEAFSALQKETVAYIQEMVGEEKMLPKYAVWKGISQIAPKAPVIQEELFSAGYSEMEEVSLPQDTLERKIRILPKKDQTVVVLPEKEYERFVDGCKENTVPYHLYPLEPMQKGINVVLGNLAQGFAIPDQDLYVYTQAELFAVHVHSGRYEDKFRNAEVLQNYQDLVPGDYIVHAKYGVGQYIGIENRSVNGVRRDYLKIVYRGNAELLVPLEQFQLVRKFVSREGVVPRLSKLGSGEWTKTRQKLVQNANEIADKLIKLYSSRKTDIGFAFSKDNELTEKFYQAFPYELTPDQQAAVEDVTKDMESSVPMDRLICGDVGFGKTEVAVRASFKAVQDHKQVAVLCPTTILAEQHYKTFCDRYQDFPVEIRVLDRFVPPAEQKQTLADLRAGLVDIIIGTHRLLSNDVVFKDLGLLVVDEEQRFGVEHKEKIKQLKNGVDVLTLSATPIPRTLQMSLIGVRSLSQLETPPKNRYSVQTYVVEKDLGLIIDAIQKELARDGQVFYLYNNIQEIYNTAMTLRAKIPDARIGVVHGQMGREEIEDVMRRFIAHEIDVLVCTTIMENGIDIPNVNTILVENAQDFGLAQIYQIKGRVGRSDRVAFAYLLIPLRRQLSEVAQKRLQAIKEFARLGSGYKIAMRDLTIRGAGNLLGSNQSGFIDTVGIDMYLEILQEAIAAKQEGREVSFQEPEANPNFAASSYIPSDFAPNDFDKLAMYQRIEKIDSLPELKNYEDEIVDQYGKLPKEVKALFEKKRLNIILEAAEIESYEEDDGVNRVTFTEEFSQKLDGVKLFSRISKLSRDITLGYSQRKITLDVPHGKNYLELTEKAILLAKECRRNAD